MSNRVTVELCLRGPRLYFVGTSLVTLQFPHYTLECGLKSRLQLLSLKSLVWPIGIVIDI